jgi:hypothetical protein
LESVINEHELLTCEPVLQELRKVLAEKFRLPEPAIKALFDLGAVRTMPILSPRQMWRRLAGMEGNPV